MCYIEKITVNLSYQDLERKKNNMCGRVKTNAVVFKIKFSCDCFTFNPFHIYVKFMFAFQTLQHI